jgi:hypothetical protein
MKNYGTLKFHVSENKCHREKVGKKVRSKHEYKISPKPGARWLTPIILVT